MIFLPYDKFEAYVKELKEMIKNRKATFGTSNQLRKDSTMLHT
jgi:predicted DNA-binding ArsR family transcriptional regulator